jgi:glutamyl-tRNA reductase
MLKMLVIKHSLFGTGKIGRNTCENLVKHTKTNTHINHRTKDKAERLAGKLNLIVKDYSELHLELPQVVATGAQNPTVDKQY